jgi:hypothetical protein
MRILLLDALVLLIPHWLTGTRSVMRRPTLMLKAGILRQLLDEAAPLLARHTRELLLLLQRSPENPGRRQIESDPRESTARVPRGVWTDRDQPGAGQTLSLFLRGPGGQTRTPACANSAGITCHPPSCSAN